MWLYLIAKYLLFNFQGTESWVSLFAMNTLFMKTLSPFSAMPLPTPLKYGSKNPPGKTLKNLTARELKLAVDVSAILYSEVALWRQSSHLATRKHHPGRPTPSARRATWSLATSSWSGQVSIPEKKKAALPKKIPRHLNGRLVSKLMSILNIPKTPIRS